MKGEPTVQLFPEGQHQRYAGTVVTETMYLLLREDFAKRKEQIFLSQCLKLLLKFHLLTCLSAVLNKSHNNQLPALHFLIKKKTKQQQ